MSLNKGKTMNVDKITEQQNPISSHIDEHSISGILKIINQEDIEVPLAVKDSLPMVEVFINDLIHRIREGGRLFYVGSGTSGRLGVLDAAECPPTYRTDPEMVQGIIAGGYDALVKSVEGAEDEENDGKKIINDKLINKNDIVIGVSASSTTKYVLSALTQAL